MSKPPRFASFEEFWPYYLGEHANPTNRALHATGTMIAAAVLLASLFAMKPWYAPLGLLPGYALAWIGHYVIEKNRPATFSHPLWSFRGDLKMVAMIVTGQLDKELADAGVGAWTGR